MQPNLSPFLFVDPPISRNTIFDELPVNIPVCLFKEVMFTK